MEVDDIPYTCTVSSVAGHPCRHVIRTLKMNGSNHRVTHFHKFWAWLTLSLSKPEMSSFSEWDQLLTSLREEYDVADKPHKDSLEAAIRAALLAPVKTLKEPLDAKAEGRPKSRSTKRDSSAF